MSPLIQALDQGYPPEEILGYISKALPNMAPAIKKATRSGYAVREILGFLSKSFDTEDRRGMSESQRHAANKRSDAASVQHGLKLAATAVAAPLAASAARSALARAVPNSLKNLPGQLLSGSASQQAQPSASDIPNLSAGNQNSSVGNNSLGNIQQQSQVQTSPNTSQQPPLSSELGNISQQKEITQPEVISNPKEYLEKLGVLDRVKSLLKTGNSPESTAAAIGIKRSGESKIDPELLKNIEEYAKSPKEVENLVKSNEISTNQEKSSPKIEKNSLVSSPNGVGSVKEIRNGHAIVDVDGKLHKVKEEELETSPLPEKELSELYDDLISGIEKETGEDVSRMVQWAGYNPETNTLQFLPHTGKLYKYSNISSEDAALLTDILSTRKTSGSNFIGAWKAGSKSPIGAALSKLIKKLQSERGGKGEEYEETHDPIYSAYEPAIQSKKKKKK